MNCKEKYKEMLISIAEYYVENIKKENRIYNALKEEDIYLEIEGRYNTGLEKIFNSISDDLCEILCDLAYDLEVELRASLGAPFERVTTVRRAIEIVLEREEND